jgi:guanine nucleotide-binding protein subunit alpha
MIKAGGFSEAERKHWRVVIFNNLVNAFQTIIASMQETNTPFRDNESIVSTL